jgi:DNA-binding LytR/AlgR family response regulator
MKKKRSRLVVRKGNEHIALMLTDIVLIYRDNTIVVVIDKDERKYLCDRNLSELEEELDDTTFFRANRKYLVNIQYIRSYRTFEKVKLEVFMNQSQNGHQIIISQENAPLFKKWINEEY